MPSTSLIYDGTPLNATSAGSGAYAPPGTGTGLYDTASTGLRGSILDVKGGVWSNSGTGGNFQGDASVAGSTGYTNAHAQFGAAYCGLLTRIKAYLPASLASGVSHAVAVRRQANGDCYLCDWDRSNGKLILYKLVSGTLTAISSFSNASAPYSSGDAYSIDLTPTGTSPTTLAVTLRDETTSSVVFADSSVTDSSSTLQRQGYPSIACWGTTGTATFTRVQLYGDGTLVPMWSDNFGAVSISSAIGGSTASDGSATWVANQGALARAATGAYLSTTGVSVHQVENIQPTTHNYDVFFSIEPGSSGAAGYQIGLATKYQKAKANLGFRFFLDGSVAYLEEQSDFTSRIQLASTGYSGFTTRADGCLSFRGQVITLTLTGGINLTLTLTAKLCGPNIGYAALYGYNPPSGGITSSVGPRIAQIGLARYAGAASHLYIQAPWDMTTLAPVVGASKVPSGLNVNKLQTLGYADNGYEGNRQVAFLLDGVLGSTFTWAPTTPGTFSSVSIAAGASAARSIFTPAAGLLTSPITITGTNSASLAETSATEAVRNKLAVFVGDSRMDRSQSTYSAIWPAMETGLAATWCLLSEAITSSRLSVPGAPDYQISTRYASTSLWHDAARGQDCVIVWGGRNDFDNGVSAATAFTALQTVVNGLKANGFINIAVCTEISSNAANVANYWAQVLAFNTSVKAAYGSTGTDTSVTVIDLNGLNSAFGTQTGYTNTSYYNGDGIHPTGASGASAISGAFLTWINSLPASQGIVAGALTVNSTGTGTVSLSATNSVNAVGACAYKLQRSYKATGGTWVDVPGQTGTDTGSGGITLADTGRDAATYFYRAAWTDTVTTVYSNVATAEVAAGSSAAIYIFNCEG